jgi:hypothetical protein
MKYADLRKKTIFDLTTDSKVLDQIIAPEDKEFFIENVSETGRATTFLELAELTNDNELEKAVLLQFKEDLKEDE